MSRSKRVRTNKEGYFKRVFLFAVPVMLTHLLQTLYSASDMFVIGRFEGEVALAAVGSTVHITTLILSLFMGLAAGAGVCVSHAIGAKKYDDISMTAHTALIIAVVTGALVATFGVVFSEPLLRLTDVPENVMPEAVLYMRIVFLGTPASLLYNYCASMLRAMGDSKRPMTYLSLSGLLNVFLNVVFVAVFGMGVAGVAIATIVSQYVSSVMVLVHLVKDREHFNIGIKRLRIYKEQLKKMLLIGIPSGVQTALFSISNVTIQSSVNSFGSTFMAGSSAVSNIEGFVHAINRGYDEAALTFVGQSVGAKRYKEIKRIVFCCIAELLLFAAVFSTLTLIFREEIISLYLKDNLEAINMITSKYVCVVVLFFFAGIMDMGASVLRCLGRPTTSMVISLIGVCALRIIWVKTIFHIWRTPLSLFVSYPVSWVLTGAVLFICSVAVIKKQRKQNALEGGENG